MFDFFLILKIKSDWIFWIVNNATANKCNRKETLAQVCKYKCAETLTDKIHNENQ